MKNILLTLFAIIFISCSSKSQNDYAEDKDEQTKSEAVVIEDGTHSATVEYHNPSTGYSTTYTLDVEVSDGQVIQINFPSGGHLDDSHIPATDLDENGFASVEDDKGRTFSVQIDD